MHLDEPVSTSLPGFHATHLAQVASFCKLQRLQDAVATSWHMTEQISSFTPHYSDRRGNFFHPPAAIYAEIQFLYISQQSYKRWMISCKNIIWHSMGQKKMQRLQRGWHNWYKCPSFSPLDSSSSITIELVERSLSGSHPRISTIILHLFC